MQNVTINSKKYGVDGSEPVRLNNGALVENPEKLFGEIHPPVSLEEYKHFYEDCDENCGSCVHREECDLCV